MALHRGRHLHKGNLLAAASAEYKLDRFECCRNGILSTPEVNLISRDSHGNSLDTVG